ncbi:heavy metal translocating P-type ATPase [Paraburkholderia megapolitana]|uniref:P-type Zn(2+) transporter n=1 Tax=Paraburkholderia megapolitana TaxID=420953 RepID=A0A1I3MP10_9BURK|nr:cation-translocating P-type ATPase [Paraburkholderia megapolitana]QDQ84081.1 cation-translocating P-type ATPase [Paraburkholderia megapolitana]SFI98699.1 ATPase, P-type (transporting), HAD superfamily, subfamily IC/heavy metal translocating P-type ATPase [Paraburkholderia megapolitana]
MNVQSESVESALGDAATLDAGDNVDNHADDNQPSIALSAAERRAVTRQIALALLAGGLLVLSLAWRYLVPDGAQLAEILAGLASLLVAGPVFAGAWHSLKSPSLHGVTDRLIALAMLAAWAIGDMTTAALLPIVMTFGHALEERSVLGSQEAIRALGRLTSGKVRRVRADGSIEEVAYEAIRAGDLVEVAAGARIPADGVVQRGRSSVDNGPITGESLPLDVDEGIAVFGGAMNLDGPLRIEVTHAGAQSTLGKIIELLQRAEQVKPPITQVLERYMGAYLALVLLIAAIVWFTSADSSAMLAVIVAACPCALVLAAPSTAIAGIAVGARHGVLFRNAAFLDRIAEIDSLVIDKTGTLTHGELHVSKVFAQPGVDTAQAVGLAARLGAGSAHPVSRALARYAAAAGHDVTPYERTRELRGLGVVAETPEGLAALGRADLLAEHVNPLQPPPDEIDGPCVGLALNGKLLAWFGFADALRAEAADALASLRELGLERQTLLTGDRDAVAHKLAAQVGIDIVVSQALPHDKLDYVMHELEAGHHPLVVGDGLNDVLAIKAGATSIAMGERGIDIAVASADIVLLGDDLRRIPMCIRLGRRCRSTATINAAIGLIWTVEIIALAAFGVLGAVWVAILHNVGTFIVIANAGRLLRIDEDAPVRDRGKTM